MGKLIIAPIPILNNEYRRIPSIYLFIFTRIRTFVLTVLATLPICTVSQGESFAYIRFLTNALQ